MIRLFAKARRRTWLAIPVLAGLLAGCADDPADQTPPEMPLPPNAPVATGPPPEPEIVARNLIAIMLSIEPDEIQIVSSEARDFPDAALDCPEPGMSYAQVITPGHRVIVEADGRRFDVRVTGRAGRICHRPKPADVDAEADGEPADPPGSARR